MLQLPLLLGHRGVRVSSSHLENSFAAFDASLLHGCDGFEFDVRATADGDAVVVHDPKWHGISVAKTQSADLKQLPRLEEVLQRYGSRAFLDIELKVAGLETNLLRMLREHPPTRDYVVSSFLPEVVQELRARRNALRLGIICDKADQLKPSLELPTNYMMVEQELVSESLVQKIHDAGRKLLVWTVNKPSAMLRLAKWGVDGIISDNPALLVSTLTTTGSVTSNKNKHVPSAEREKPSKKAKG